MIDHESADELATTHRKLQRLNRLYAMLSRINRSIVRVEDPYELYERACRIAVDDGGFFFAWIGLIEPVGERILPVARAGAPVDLDRSPIALASPGDDRCTAAIAIRERRPCFVNDVAAASELPSRWKSVLGEIGARAVAALPLFMDERVIGVMMVAAAEADYFLAAEEQLLAEVTEDISYALQTMRREEQRLAAETKIQYLAYYDAETGLPGRVLFAERLGAGGEQAVLAISLRRYHGILQALGQEAGARLARTIANRLETLLPTSAVGRISESAFACLLDAADSPHLVEETAWRLHRGLAEPLQIDGSEVFLDPFIGIAAHPRDGTATEVIDAALFAAGTGNKDASGCCRFFVAGMD
ncbi:MAG TPA: GAF domain-containing protein, partial [Rhodocyclaceae bacterium]|nr:GAF domain-containing protein [Rhodocyclaceae bacterium]